MNHLQHVTSVALLAGTAASDWHPRAHTAPSFFPRQEHAVTKHIPCRRTILLRTSATALHVSAVFRCLGHWTSQTAIAYGFQLVNNEWVALGGKISSTKSYSACTKVHCDAAITDRPDNQWHKKAKTDGTGSEGPMYASPMYSHIND